MIKHLFQTFDRGLIISSKIKKPDRLRFLKDTHTNNFRISRGSGLSYAAASFGEGITSISHEFFNKIIFFDPLNKKIEVEAGITLGALYNFLINYNLYLKIQPGYSHISVGGCIACDVHGKNQSLDGNFKDQVIGINLFHPLHGNLYLSKAKNKEIFDLTCGGLGLTGQIISIRLKLHEMPTDNLTMESKYFRDFSSSIQYLKENKSSYNSIYGWHDFNIKNKDFADGIIFAANFSKKTIVDKTNVIDVDAKRPWTPPFSLFNIHSGFLANTIFKFKNSISKNGIISMKELLFPIESHNSYYSFFGSKGFCEYQFIIPEPNIAIVLDKLKYFIYKFKLLITLSSTKYFSGGQSYLRFREAGLCLALNFKRDEKSGLFLKFLDDLMVEHNCLPNIIKDSRLPRHVIDSTYFEIDIFRKNLRAFDRKRLFRSETSMRLGL